LQGDEASAMRAGDPGSWMWTEACALVERAERLQRQFFQPGRFAAPAASWEPPIDILETEQELSIIAALPGVEPQDLEITIDQDVLSIAGVRRLPAWARAAAIRRLEIPYGHFQRVIELPAVRIELGRPELVNGCLFLTLAKRP
jgi:HSP20 family molecular chaperone IbpA